MASRIARLWQPGAPQTRSLLPDFWMAVVRSSTVGRARLPANCVKFEVDPRMSKHDVREYLEKVYQAPVRSVRTEVQMGEILWNSKTDYQYKKAMWKEEDKKYAYVFMEKNYKFVFPMELTFSESEEVREIEKHKEQMEKIGENSKFVNSDRGTVGRLLS
uniref:Large ribosomal subunit protein uL23m n=1 Tax=Pristionchus pacificus TaxID=54126 RepID=A0A8R1Z981_PRIPA